MIDLLTLLIALFACILLIVLIAVATIRRPRIKFKDPIGCTPGFHSMKEVKSIYPRELVNEIRKKYRIPGISRQSFPDGEGTDKYIRKECILCNYAIDEIKPLRQEYERVALAYQLKQKGKQYE